MADYWQSLTQSRLTRRRAIAGAGAMAGAAAALSLLGCGSSSSSSGGGKTSDKSGLVGKPVDTTASAKAGGTFKDFATLDILHFDAGISNSTGVVNQISIFAYPRLLKFSSAKYPKLPDGGSEGDFAQSFEVSPDKLQITFKLRPGVKWDSRAPTSGRLADSQDVLTSWKRYTALNPSASDLAYDAAKAPGSAVESVTAPDAQTVVLKMKQPDSSVVPLLSEYAHFYVLPKEADGGFDAKTNVRGAGPWILDEFTPSARSVWRKNPDYFVSNRPFPDKLERPIVLDYAQQLAQFKAGNLWTTVARQEDVVKTKQDVPATVLLSGNTFATSGNYISFGYEGNSPFKDERMRQAMSMTLDRDAFASVVENLDGFKRDGLDNQVAYHTIVYAGWLGYWLDPTDAKTFGPSSQYLQLNLAEAKKLMAAAGFADGADFDYVYDAENQYGDIYHQIAQLFSGMFRNGNFRPKEQPLPYQNFFDNYFNGYVSKNGQPGKGFSGAMLRAGRAFPRWARSSTAPCTGTAPCSTA